MKSVDKFLNAFIKQLTNAIRQSKRKFVDSKIVEIDKLSYIHNNDRVINFEFFRTCDSYTHHNSLRDENVEDAFVTIKA